MIRYDYQCRYNFLYNSVEGGVTPFIISGIVLKSLFARILTPEIVMWKSSSKIGMIDHSSNIRMVSFLDFRLNLIANLPYFLDYFDIIKINIVGYCRI